MEDNENNKSFATVMSSLMHQQSTALADAALVWEQENPDSPAAAVFMRRRAFELMANAAGTQPDVDLRAAWVLEAIYTGRQVDMVKECWLLVRETLRRSSGMQPFYTHALIEQVRQLGELIEGDYKDAASE